MEKAKNFIKQELYGWKAWEAGWLLLACGVITALALYWGDSPVGIISATTGAACVVCTGKGKLSAYLFGAVNTLLYALISYKAAYYGEVMLNLLYFFPLQFYGFAVWRKNMDQKTREVRKRKMTLKGTALLAVLVSVLTLVYGLFLRMLGGSLPFVDAFSTVVSVVAMMVSVRMFAEQWLLWIAVNIVTIFMWGHAFFAQGSESIATLLMWCVYLINAVIMCVKWYRASASGGEIRETAARGPEEGREREDRENEI